MDHRLFAPHSVAIIGASERTGSVGRSVVENMLAADFRGSIWLVNPKYRRLFGRPCYRDVAALPGSPDLAVVAAPARAAAAIVEGLVRRATGMAIIMSAGFSDEEQSALAARARAGGMRILGPNCLGLLLPHKGVNASFAPSQAKTGGLAFLSQSGAILSAGLDWATARSIGFSGMVSIGNAADIDLPELIDHFADDGQTSAILLYIEAIRNARSFISSARRAVRLKPVVVMKVGRHPDGARAALSHTGALAESDFVYDAALRRCGILRVYSLEELFDTGALLSLQRPFTGEKLAIITNGGGAGIIAADRLADYQGSLADLSEETLLKLDGSLPPSWSRTNPVDLVGDADENRYRVALQAVLDDPDVHAALVLRCPTSMALAEGTARVVADLVVEHRKARDWHKPVLTCWLGGSSVQGARAIFERAEVPTFESPEDAVRAAAHLVGYSQARESVLCQPKVTEYTLQVNYDRARQIIDEHLDKGQEVLNEQDAKKLIEAYGIPIAETQIAANPREAADITGRLLAAADGPSAVVLKIASPDITHKSDVGGVCLGISNVDQAVTAAEAMWAAVAEARPQARLTGIAVQPMVGKVHGRQLILGINRDPTFGATLLFGAGGTAVEVLDDKALELPPLDDHLARSMICRTRISRLLAGYRHVPAAKIDQIVEMLMRLSRLARDLPEVVELDINPLLANEEGVIALDARAMLRKVGTQSGNVHLAIAPRPDGRAETHLDDKRRRVLLRPILPTDESLYPDFLAHTSQHDLRMRLFAVRNRFNHDDFARWTQIDFEREMAVVAIDEDGGDLIGVARYASDPDTHDGEFALIVRSDRQMRGIGTMLMRELLGYAKASGLERLTGLVLKSNLAMRDLCRSLGFSEEHGDWNAETITVSRKLAHAEADWAEKARCPPVQIQFPALAEARGSANAAAKRRQVE